VILSIDGSLSGTFRFLNEALADRTVSSAYLFNNPGFSFTADGHSSSETFTYSDPNTPFVVAGGQTINHGFSSGGNGLAQTDITGTDKLSTSLSLGFQISGLYDEDIVAGLKNLSGSANVSDTYLYDYTAVPEPTSLALLSFGCAALLARRRRKAN